MKTDLHEIFYDKTAIYSNEYYDTEIEETGMTLQWIICMRFTLMEFEQSIDIQEVDVLFLVAKRKCWIELFQNPHPNCLLSGPQPSKERGA